MPDLIEYRIRPVTRFIVTRFEMTAGNGVSKTLGEFENADLAHQAGHALAFSEREALGWPPGDDRIQFPPPVPLVSPSYPPANGA